MSTPPVHTVPHGDGWTNRRARSSRVSRAVRRRAGTQVAVRATARREHTRHVIHREPRTLSERNSYGNDPHLPKG